MPSLSLPHGGPAPSPSDLASLLRLAWAGGSPSMFLPTVAQANHRKISSGTSGGPQTVLLFKKNYLKLGRANRLLFRGPRHGKIISWPSQAIPAQSV